MKLDPWELAEIKLRRENKQPTRAMEAKYYRDPLQSVEFESERKRKEKAKELKRKDGNKKAKRNV